MVVRITKDDKIFVDGTEKLLKDIDSSFLNDIFSKLLKKQASIEFEDDEEYGYVGKLFLEIKNATSEDGQFYKEYNDLRQDFNDVNKQEKELNDTL